MTRWIDPKKKEKRSVFEIIPVPHGWEVALLLNGKRVKVDKKTDPLKLGWRLGVDEVDIPKGWYQTCTACPMQYSKIVRIGKDYYEGYLRSRWDSVFRVKIQLLYRNWRTRDHPWKKDEFWTHGPVDTCDDNPPIKSMRLINRQFSKMVKEHEVNKKVIQGSI